MSGLRVLVTGGAGYIGSHVTLGLLEAGVEPIVLDNLSTGVSTAVPKGVRLVVGDLKDETLLATLFDEVRFDAVMHFAASTVAPLSVADPFTFYTNNTSNTTQLGALAARSGVKAFIFSSTAAVYQSAGMVAVAEDAPKVPESPYGWSKLLSEKILEDMARASGMTLGVFRYFNVAGADPGGRAGQSGRDATHLIKVVCEHAAGKREAITIYGNDYPTPDGTGVRDYVHVSDLAAAHIAGLQHLLATRRGFTLNCGYGRGASVLEVIEACRRVSGRSLQVKVSGRRPGDPPVLLADATRLRTVLNWTPRFDDLDEIVRSAMAWENHLHTAHALDAV